MPIEENEVELAHPLPTRGAATSTQGEHASQSTRRQGITLMVRFRTRDTRDKVISRRKILKGTNRTIVEDLTSLNIETMNRLRKHEQVEKTWSWNGHIYAMLRGGKKIVVRPFETVADSVNRQL